MGLISGVLAKTIAHRTGLKAEYNGIVIDGCDQCGENREEEGPLPGIPVHRCKVRLGIDGKNALIWDPGNIPFDCPYAIGEKV